MVSVLIGTTSALFLFSAALAAYQWVLAEFHHEKDMIEILWNKRKMEAVLDFQFEQSYFMCEGKKRHLFSDDVEILSVHDKTLPMAIVRQAVKGDQILVLNHYGFGREIDRFFKRGTQGMFRLMRSPTSEWDPQADWVITDCRHSFRLRGTALSSGVKHEFEQIQFEWPEQAAPDFVPRYVMKFHRDYYFLKSLSQRSSISSSWFQYGSQTGHTEEWLSGIDKISFELLNSQAVLAHIWFQSERIENSPLRFEFLYYAKI